VHSAAADEINKTLQNLPMYEKARVIVGKSHDILAVSEAALVVSGTVTMEALVSKTPMVVAIRVAGLSYQILKRMLKTPFVAMPNVLAGGQIVAEFVQHEASVDNLSAAMKKCIGDQHWRQQFKESAELIRDSLAPPRADIAAQSVLNLVDE
jgi:lipid-A-disaccharide synthase